MKTRAKLYLAVLACILCLIIVWSTEQPHRPFERLTAEMVASFDVETEIGITVTISDHSECSALTELLNRLTVFRRADTEEEALAVYTIHTGEGVSYELTVYNGFVRLDSVVCSADPAHTDALYEFAKQFA